MFWGLFRRSRFSKILLCFVGAYLCFMIVTLFFTNDLYSDLQIPKFTKSISHFGVLVLACDRGTVTRTLAQIFEKRPTGFPVVVSFDCASEGQRVMDMVLRTFANETALNLIQHPGYQEVKRLVLDHKVPIHMQSYYQLSAHYRWAISYMFHELGFETVIIVEGESVRAKISQQAVDSNDLDISPDFFEYFIATHTLLSNDPTLWCVSAYNDNGKPDLINQSAPEQLHRSDFFPGLGWMLRKSLWDELESKWPISFWDDWMREPNQRRGRACIRPEISRTKTYGRSGASGGQFFDQHLNSIKLNDQFVAFTQLDLGYLEKDFYDETFWKQIRHAKRVKSLDELPSETDDIEKKSISYLIKYETEAQFIKLADRVNLMTDFKAGVPRGGYEGIVSFVHNGVRVYFAPVPKKRHLRIQDMYQN